MKKSWYSRKPNPFTDERVGVNTPIGELSCEVHADRDYPGLTVYWNERQIAVIEQSQGTEMMRVLVWDTDNENPSSVCPVFPGYGEGGAR